MRTGDKGCRLFSANRNHRTTVEKPILVKDPHKEEKQPWHGQRCFPGGCPRSGFAIFDALGQKRLLQNRLFFKVRFFYYLRQGGKIRTRSRGWYQL